MRNWSTRDIPDLTGKTAIVTGANSGLGFHTTAALAARGAHVVMACRDEARTATAIAKIEAQTPDARLEFRELDLASLASIRRFADAVLATVPKLDLLINNAGVMALPMRRTQDGFEMQIGTNHLGHFALTGLLLERVLATPSARVVTLSSLAHVPGHISLDDLNWKRRRYFAWPAYMQAKLANLMFAIELQRRLSRAGSDVISVAAHPGYAATNLQFAGAQMRRSKLEELFYSTGNKLISQSAEAGALPTLYAATATDVKGGEYFGPGSLGELRGSPTRARIAGRARKAVTSARLWKLSEELTGVSFLSGENH